MRSFRRPVCAALASAVSASLLLGLPGAALASNMTPPKLKAPRQGQRVHAGAIRLVVYEPRLASPLTTVFVVISPRRKLDKYGFLSDNLKSCSVQKGCDVIPLRRWKGHPGYYTYTTKPANEFPGDWASTPHRYFWQARYVPSVCQTKGCQVVSQIHSFRVFG